MCSNGNPSVSNDESLYSELEEVESIAKDKLEDQESIANDKLEEQENIDNNELKKQTKILTWTKWLIYGRVSLEMYLKLIKEIMTNCYRRI